MGKYRSLEQTERVALVDTFETKAREVAAILGDDWTMRHHANEEVRREGLCYLVNKDGRRICLNVRLYEHPVKINVSGEYEPGPDFLGLRGFKNNQRPSISVSVDRPAKAIAKDIERRFLPDYTPLFLETKQVVAEHLARWDMREDANKRLAAVAEAKYISAHEWRGAAVEGHVWNRHDGAGLSVSLKIDGLTESRAAQIIGFVKSFSEGGS